MASETIILTALPNGFNGARRKVSVFVSPRLTPSPNPGTLAQFPNWLDWPAQMRSVTTWTVSTGGPQLVGTVTSPVPRTDLWHALFPSSTPVTGWTPQTFAAHVVRSYPVASIQSLLQSLHRNVATGNDYDGERPEGAGDPPPIRDPGVFPDFRTLLQGNAANVGLLESMNFALSRGNHGGLFDREQGVIADNEGTLSQQRYNSATSPRNDLLLLKRFHDRRAPDTVAPVVPKFDFHSLVSLLGDHPRLLRLLGLVVDLEIGTGDGGLPFISVSPTWSPAVTPNSLQNTPTVYDPPSFRAAFTEAAHSRDGWQRFDDTSQFNTTAVDIDSGGLKVYDWMRSVWFRLGYLFDPDSDVRVPIHSDDTVQALPALRTGGISAFQVGRAAATVAFFDRHDNMDANSSWTGEMLTRGHRVDVWDNATNKWHQLCARSAGATGGYHFLRPPPGATVVPPADEGWVSEGFTKDDPSALDVYQGESLFYWKGWSLVAPRPGRPFSAAPGQAPVDPPGNVSMTSLRLEVSYAATPATLPALRFGRLYRLRSRAVDLAGNSQPFTPTFGAAFPYMTGEIFYGRFDPVQSPALVMRKPRTEGQSIEHMVVRSNYNVADSTVPVDERHCAAPMSSEEMVEHHGKLDTAGKLDPSKFTMLTQRDGKTFVNGGTVDPNNFGSVYHDVNLLPVPYLPDPIGMGATLQNVPGASAIIKIPFFDTGAVWPVSRAFRIVLKAGSGAPILPTAGNNYALTIFLPKTQEVDIELSCNLNVAGLNTLGLWKWIQDAGFETPALRSLVLSGKHWQFTPSRTIKLIHAIRQPLVEPEFTGLASNRTAIGQTDTVLTGGVKIDRKSTVKLEMKADWDEPIDPLGEPRFRFVRGGGTAFSIDVRDDGGLDKVTLSNRHEFHDTKHRNVNYAAIGASRFLEYFAATKNVTLTGVAAAVIDGAGFVPGTDSVKSIVTPPTVPVAYVRGVDYKVDEAAGTIARITGSAIPSGATVLVRYVTPPVTRSSLETITSPEVARGFPVNVLSTKRPDAPDPHYLVPTFAWQGPSVPPGAVQSVRTGNGLRVYLARPWFSSGDGELLGVVLIPGSQPVTNPPSVPDIVLKHGTLWGRDPIWTTNGPRAALNPSAFPLAVNVKTGLSIDEVPDSLYDVAGHAVQYDDARRLWFSDLVIDPGTNTSYNPFYRLALARYQPDSITNAHLSHIVLTDVYPLSPTRTATVTFSAVDASKLTLSVSGITYQASTEHPLPVVTVEVQTRRPGVAGQLGWQTSGSPITIPAPVVTAGVSTWTTPVQLPDERNTRPFRLLIREAEQYADGSGGFAHRLVYADVIEI